MKKKAAKYNMSFTAGGLHSQDSVRIAKLFMEINNWTEVRQHIIEQNILQSRTQATLKRLSKELCSRLQCLNMTELQILIDGTSQEQAQVLWLAICRKHRFIYEFAVEVLRERFLTFRYDLAYSDFDTFFNSKAAWSEELDVIANSTREKLRQVLFRILHEIGVLSTKNMILPIMLSSRVVSAVGSSNLEDLTVFPVSQQDLIKMGINR